MTAETLAAGVKPIEGRTMRRLLIFLLLFCRGFAYTQQVPQPSPAPVLQLSPQAAYDQAVHPLDVVRDAAVNWSDSELAALAVARDLAKTECLARSPDRFAGEDLLAYARLCAFAQQWLAVKKAGTNYLIARNAASPAEQLTAFPSLSLAFDYVIQSSLHLAESTNAFGTAQTMLRTVPYDAYTSEATNAIVRYVQLLQTDQAIEILSQRQPLLLALLKARTISVAQTAPTAQISNPSLSIHDLYADAIALPAMLQFAKSTAAASTFAELEATVPRNPPPDDSILITDLRRRYLLLGSPMPPISASAWLFNTSTFTPPRDLNKNFGAASIFLLFPDWCAQCVAAGRDFTSAAARLNKDGVYFYALLAQSDPKPPTPKEAPKLPLKSSAASTSAKAAKPPAPSIELNVSVKPIPSELLLGTPTLIVPMDTLHTFVASDVPLIIATDSDGVVRYIQPAPDNALVPGGLIDQIADRIVNQWSPPAR